MAIGTRHKNEVNFLKQSLPDYLLLNPNNRLR